MPPASPLPPRDLQGSSKGPDKLFDGAASSKKDDARVNEEAYHSRLGHNLMEQFNLLWRQLAQQKGHPRNVVARSRKTRDHAELDRIAAHREYDRDCFGDHRSRIDGGAGAAGRHKHADALVNVALARANM